MNPGVVSSNVIRASPSRAAKKFRGVEFRTRRGGAIEHLIRCIVFDFSLARAPRPFLLFNQGIEVPDAVDEFRDPARATQVGRELVFRGSAHR